MSDDTPRAFLTGSVWWMHAHCAAASGRVSTREQGSAAPTVDDSSAAAVARRERRVG